jgi:hypothetical protein
MEKISRLKRDRPWNTADLERRLAELRSVVDNESAGDSQCSCLLLAVLQQLVPTYSPGSRADRNCRHRTEGPDGRQ